MTIEEVQSLHATFTLAAGNAEKLRDERNAAIRLLVAEGMRVSDVARALTRLSLNALGVEHGLNGDDNFHDAVRSVSTLAESLGCGVVWLNKLVAEEEAACESR